MNAHAVYYSNLFVCSPVLSMFMSTTYHFWNNGGFTLSYGEVVTSAFRPLMVVQVIGFVPEVG